MYGGYQGGESSNNSRFERAIIKQVTKSDTIDDLVQGLSEEFDNDQFRPNYKKLMNKQDYFGNTPLNDFMSSINDDHTAVEKKFGTDGLVAVVGVFIDSGTRVNESGREFNHSGYPNHKKYEEKPENFPLNRAITSFNTASDGGNESEVDKYKAIAKALIEKGADTSKIIELRYATEQTKAFIEELAQEKKQSHEQSHVDRSGLQKTGNEGHVARLNNGADKSAGRY